MQHPIIHLNGTGCQGLADQFRATGQALRQAIDALCAAWPNTRDYYLVPGAFEAASREHQSRLDRVLSVYDEILALYEKVVGEE